MTKASTLIDADLLYVEIDLGSEVSLDEYVNQVEILRDTQNFLFRRSRVATRPHSTGRHRADAVNELRHFVMQQSSEFSQQDSLTVVRTSLASPWITILSDIGAQSKPILYGGTVLLGLQQLLNMVMAWQIHREEVEDRRSARTADGPTPTELALIELLKANPESFSPHQHTPSDHVEFGDAGRRLSELGRVSVAELISRDDPRTRGD